jgi:hypothetical protein
LSVSARISYRFHKITIAFWGEMAYFQVEVHIIRVPKRRSLRVRKLILVVGVLALFVGFVLLDGSSLGANKATEEAEKPVFVDLDGDGFDDGATPENQNPTVEKPKSNAAGNLSSDTTTVTGFVDLGSALAPKNRLFLNNSSAFAFAKRLVVSGLQHRGGFGSASDFGSGNDIGSGTVIGGVCVGGICR